MPTTLISTGVQFPDDTIRTIGIFISGAAVNSNIARSANLFVISNFDSFTTYTLSTSNGTVTRSGNTITYTPSSVGTGSFVVNGRTIGPFNVV